MRIGLRKCLALALMQSLFFQNMLVVKMVS